MWYLFYSKQMIEVHKKACIMMFFLLNTHEKTHTIVNYHKYIHRSVCKEARFGCNLAVGIKNCSPSPATTLLVCELCLGCWSRSSFVWGTKAVCLLNCVFHEMSQSQGTLCHVSKCWCPTFSTPTFLWLLWPPMQTFSTKQGRIGQIKSWIAFNVT